MISNKLSIALVLFTLSLLACGGEVETVLNPSDAFGTPGEVWCAPAKTIGTSAACPNGFSVKVYGKNVENLRSIVRAKRFWEYAGAPTLNVESIPEIEKPENTDYEECVIKVYEVPQEEISGSYAYAWWKYSGETTLSTSACTIVIAKENKPGNDYEARDLGMTHEVGHCYGLHHVQDRDDIMFPSIFFPGRNVDFSIATKWDGQELNKRYGSSCE
jgi:hypothetical protein